MSSDEDDIPIAILRKRMKQKKKSASTTVKDKKLAKARTAAATARAGMAKNARPKAKAPKKKSQETKKAAKGKSKKRPAPKAASKPAKGGKRQRTAFQYNKLDTKVPLKSQAVARILVRWKYCMKMPAASSAPPTDSPKDYVALPGYPGVWVGVMGDATGKVLDQRPTTGRPCYSDLIQMPAKELQALWIQSLEAQLEELLSLEGESAPYVPSLRVELATAKKFNHKKAEKDYAKSGQ